MHCWRNFICLFVSLILLTLITIFSFRSHTFKLRPLELFENRSQTIGLSAENKAIFLELLTTFDTLGREVNATYFLYGGTLIGSLRHDDILPWDDDVDLAMDYDDYDGMKDRFEQLGEYGTMLTDTSTFKIWRLDSNITTDWEWKWPFLDVFLFQMKEDFIQFMSWDNHSFPFDSIFPLEPGRMMNLTLPLPRRPQDILLRQYGAEVFHKCKTHFWNHKLEKYMKNSVVQLNCSELSYLYKFRPLPNDEGSSSGGEESA